MIQCLQIHKFDLNTQQCLGSIKSGSALGKKWIQIQVISMKITEFFQQSRIFKFLSYFFLFFFMLKSSWWIIQKSRNFYNLSFFNSSDFGFKSKFFFLSFLLIFCILDLDPWIRIFIQNLKDPDPDPRHWYTVYTSLMDFQNILWSLLWSLNLYYSRIFPHTWRKGLKDTFRRQWNL